MINLAGNVDATEICTEELERCGIPIVPLLGNPGEVPSTIMGKLGPFTFERYWYYWVARGPVPIKLARELYGTKVGMRDIRAGGSDRSGNDPDAEANWYLVDDRELVHDPKGDQAKSWEALTGTIIYQERLKYCYTSTPPKDSPEAKGFVESYHIDSELGLYMFVEALKRAGLDKV